MRGGIAFFLILIGIVLYFLIISDRYYCIAGFLDCMVRGPDSPSGQASGSNQSGGGEFGI